MKNEKIIVIINESVIGSIVKDVFTFGMFAGLLWFNHAYLSGSTFIDFLFILCVILFLAGRSSKNIFRGNKAEAIGHLHKLATPQSKGGLR